MLIMCMCICSYNIITSNLVYIYIIIIILMCNATRFGFFYFLLFASIMLGNLKKKRNAKSCILGLGTKIKFQTSFSTILFYFSSFHMTGTFIWIFKYDQIIFREIYASTEVNNFSIFFFRIYNVCVTSDMIFF